MFRKRFLSCILAGLAWALQAQDVSEYIEIIPGTLPIILTVPHGGQLKPNSILSRRYGVTTRDSNTTELGLMILDEMRAIYGGSPHAVICHLHRGKLDCNRDIQEAAQDDPVAIAAWKRFHHAAEEMEQQVTLTHGAGLTIDLHGHRHEEARVELGYLISGSLLNTSDSALNQNSKFLDMSSIRDLSKRSPQSFAELIRGPQSLGALLENQKFPSIPSPTSPSPGRTAYFSGAYDIVAHGSRDGGSISAIQIECPWLGVRDTEENQHRFAKALAIALGQYFELHFKMPLRASASQPPLPFSDQ